MINIKAFIKYLLRYKWIIIAVPLISIAATAYLLRDMPSTFRSQTLLSTGIVDQAKLVLNGQQVDYFKASQLFGNIIEMMKMKRVISSLTYRLILHDLMQSDQPFRPLTDDLQKLSDKQRRLLIKTYQQHLADGKVLTTTDWIDEMNLFDIAASMGYDEHSLLDGLTIQRSGNSDFIQIGYSSENPELSAFVVNTIAKEFIFFYTTSISSNQENSLVLLDSLLRAKERQMNERNAALSGYKSASGALNLNSQSQVVYQQIAEVESRRSKTIQQIESLRGAIARINQRLNDDGDVELGSNTLATNNEIIQIEQQLEIANRRYVENNFNVDDKRVVDSLTRLKTAKIRQSSTTSGANPRILRESLINERMQMETQLALAENSMKSIQSELNGLRARYGGMVPADADVQKLEREADIASRDYMDALNRYNQASLNTSTSFRLGIAEPGLPGPPENSKKIIYLGLSGVASFSLCFSILFLMFIANRRVNTVEELANFVASNVIGNLNFIPGQNTDINTIWNDQSGNKDFGTYKALLRSIRFKISKLMNESNAKILGVTGVHDDDGKTFFCAGLAYAFMLTGKRVLLIGENYDNLSQMITTNTNERGGGGINSYNFERFLVKREIDTDGKLTILDRNREINSLLEVQDESTLASGFELLRQSFDLVIVDIVNMNGAANSADEWLFFTDKSIAVYKAGTQFSEDYSNVSTYLKSNPGFLGWILNKTRRENLKSMV
ncbi:tyrosine protein kinase [Parapedobacter defluvii]|uniref:Tyrosine protein kinase n=1 Tax=Parapedobacter defluvii TaxID=2045106 RepID=A0ABQ1LUN0_9SPHI|nr:lipopolysaccharide biosynthesis protein [Parapedobacter defluvii]GGC30060.1 tyrosine protein kinase [Parapedobacter defluvii]